VIGRREFLAAAIAAGAVAAARVAASAPSGESRIEVIPGEPLGTISPAVYGHFVENLGGVVYDGIWVGEDSPVPNVGGIRRDLVDALRALKPAVIRYPGGCFADSYDWSDGVGAPQRRPVRTSFWADNEPAAAPAAQRYDTNRFGTDEFVRFCTLVGAQPYLAANVRSLPAESFDRWVEYCNAPAGSTTLAAMRASDGSTKPFDVRYWAVGNEAWGCGGLFTAREYAEEFCRFVAAVPDYGVDLRFVASGPDKADWAWTRGFFEAVAARPGALDAIFGFALHDYTWNLSRGKTPDWVRGKGDALQFAPIDWYELLRVGGGIEALIDGHWRIMAQTDPAHRVKLVVDEWGSWYRPGSAQTAWDLFEQTPTLRDAVYSAQTLDAFNRHPDKVAMANCAQLVNCLNSPFLAHEDKFCVTPVGHVFAMYAGHQGGTALRADFSAPPVAYDRDGTQATLPSISGAASLRGKTLTISATNAHVSESRSVVVTARGTAIAGGTIATLANADIRAHNSFARPDAVVPATSAIVARDGSTRVVLPPASVNVLTLTLTGAVG
jgi:alpha-N-arabinofuranosidase